VYVVVESLFLKTTKRDIATKTSLGHMLTCKRRICLQVSSSSSVTSTVGYTVPLAKSQYQSRSHCHFHVGDQEHSTFENFQRFSLLYGQDHKTRAFGLNGEPQNVCRSVSIWTRCDLMKGEEGKAGRKWGGECPSSVIDESTHCVDTSTIPSRHNIQCQESNCVVAHVMGHAA